MSTLDQIYSEIREVITIMPESNGTNVLIVNGEPGFGKTYQVIQLLKSMGYAKNEEDGFGLVAGRSTYRELIKQLYRFKDSDFIVLDDLWGVLEKESVLGIIKKATETHVDKRYIENHTRQTKNYDIPDRFEFCSNLIIITNSVPDNTHIQAIINRGRRIDIDYNLKTKYQILEAIRKEKQIPKVILEFIETVTNEATDNLSIRTLLRGFDYYQSLDNWKEHIASELQVDEEKKVVINLLEKEFTSEAERVDAFKDQTELSEKTYYRIKNSL